jgi:serine/threonine-protein kinase HipA
LNFTLELFAGASRMARIGHDPLDDAWALEYAPEWLNDPAVYPLSPALPLTPPERGYDSRSIKRFIEHLLPEGHALDVAVASNGLARSNVFGLIRALGAETAGALRFRDADKEVAAAEHGMREIPLDELDARIADREQPFTVWDGKVRMSVAGCRTSCWSTSTRRLSGRLRRITPRRTARDTPPPPPCAAPWPDRPTGK